MILILYFRFIAQDSRFKIQDSLLPLNTNTDVHQVVYNKDYIKTLQRLYKNSKGAFINNGLGGGGKFSKRIPQFFFAPPLPNTLNKSCPPLPYTLKKSCPPPMVENKTSLPKPINIIWYEILPEWLLRRTETPLFF
jgi:hypothetical protein